MVTATMLVQPEVDTFVTVGTDGLTNEEREAYAAEYRATAGSRYLNSGVRAAMDRALARRAAN
jgi:hypothetical protein